MAKNHSLADKLAALTNPTPEFNQENDEDEDTVTGAKVTEGEYGEDDDIGGDGRSYLRTKNAPNLEDDVRYQGKKIGRKDYLKDRDFMEHSTAELGHMFDIGDDEEDEEEGDDEEDEDDDEDGEEETELEREGESDVDKDDEESNEENENSKDNSEDDDDEAEDEFDIDISTFAAKNDVNSRKDQEVSNKEENLFKVSESDSLFAKSQAVTCQLSCWDKLLEQRIMLQKMLTKVNTFPQNVDSFIDQDDPEHVKLVNKANKSLSSLLLKSVQLKHCIDRKGIEDSKIMKRKLEDMNDWLEQDFAQGEKKRNERIEMWSDRTQRLGAMGSMNTPTLEQIEQIVSNMPRLVKRTKVARVECNVLGEERMELDEQQENPNIFDDSDFYHHLLRELIEKKTSTNSESGEVGKHWLQIQKLRSKLNKKVDTRASKGRKVRYDIHTKLVNFMAPVRISDPMADSARQELFSSLFDARRS